MILQCNYEEITSLRQGAQAVLHGRSEGECVIAVVVNDRAAVESVASNFSGDLEFHTLEEYRVMEQAVGLIVECLRVEMDVSVHATHPADERAVAAYFDYAHAYSVLARLREVGTEMEALIELVTGAPATGELAHTFHFPD